MTKETGANKSRGGGTATRERKREMEDLTMERRGQERRKEEGAIQINRTCHIAVFSPLPLPFPLFLSPLSSDPRPNLAKEHNNNHLTTTRYPTHSCRPALASGRSREMYEWKRGKRGREGIDYFIAFFARDVL